MLASPQMVVRSVAGRLQTSLKSEEGLNLLSNISKGTDTGARGGCSAGWHGAAIMIWNLTRSGGWDRWPVRLSSGRAGQNRPQLSHASSRKISWHPIWLGVTLSRTLRHDVDRSSLSNGQDRQHGPHDRCQFGECHSGIGSPGSVFSSSDDQPFCWLLLAASVMSCAARSRAGRRAVRTAAFVGRCSPKPAVTSAHSP